ncbi:uncharacterized protein DSM5745_02801 [Aspergillus mulundensis]|uniref:Tim44-like domain-containing protein n=1 Tax=Aspergillus mulundensis TaxID=1810919 RepID=A0A3D8SIJ7_9EURO|nr:Uncharacterized protein DSM5745_02801 [Aspergillus mulundensis]RDW86159.1 Uncharacterized protein DSM5745_02801 [Aspergillus mulundensis]
MASSISGAPLLSAARARTAALSSYSTVGSSQCRQFSLSSQRSREMKGMPQSFSMKQPAQPSMKIRTSEMSRTELPQDIGLLPGTFIKPLWRDLPSIFKQPKERLQFEWLWLKSWFQNFLGLVVYSKSEGRALPLRLRERRLVARDIHQRMYSAFARGETGTVRNICCTGLANSLVKRIEARPKGEQVTWSLDKYIRSPSTWFTGIRVVSDRATQLPNIADSGVRQVVLRITSRQSTGKAQRRAKNGTPAEGSGKQQDCMEYIVIQKLRWMGEEEGWRVWGHATPTTVEDLSSPFFATDMSFADRYEAMKDAAMGTKK